MPCLFKNQEMISTASKQNFLALVLTALISSADAQATCTSSSPQCCWVVRIWQLMGQITSVNPSSSTECCGMAGVTCSESTVTGIFWSIKGLKNSIPSDIGNLINLTDL